jgi:hypothetical protein
VASEPRTGKFPEDVADRLDEFSADRDLTQSRAIVEAADSGLARMGYASPRRFAVELLRELAKGCAYLGAAFVGVVVATRADLAALTMAFFLAASCALLAEQWVRGERR